MEEAAEEEAGDATEAETEEEGEGERRRGEAEEDDEPRRRGMANGRRGGGEGRWLLLRGRRVKRPREVRNR